MRLVTVAVLAISTLLIGGVRSESEDLWSTLRVWDPLLPLPWGSSEIGVSEECAVRMIQYAYGLTQRQAWASKMLDATGRVNSKFLFGSEFWLGSRVECAELGKENSALEEVASGNVSQFPPPPQTTYVRVTLSVNLSLPLTPQSRKISLGLCLPADCGSSADVKRLMELMIDNTSPRGPASFRDIRVQRVRAVPGEYSFWRDPAFIVLLCISAVLLILSIAGTSLEIAEVYALKNTNIVSAATKLDKIECNGNHLSYTAEGPGDAERAKMKPSSGQCRVHEEQSTGLKLPKWLWRDVLLSFSLRQNVRRFFSSKGVGTQEGSLGTVHGLRVFSLVWVIACHTCLYAFAFSDNKLFRSTVEKDFLFQSISNGNFSVDTFFFVSGMLISYVFLRGQMKRPTNKETYAQSGNRFFGFFIYRFLRLTPPYLFVLIVVMVTMRWFESQSVFDPPTWDHLTCGKYWWRNVLYINTLFPVHQMCMIWSWYLAADTQFYVVGTLLLLVYIRKPRVAIVSGLVLLLSSWITTGAISLSLDHTPSIEKPLDMFDVLYDKPWTRFGPYLVGMAAGWLLANNGGNIKMSRIAVIAGWTLSITTTFGLVHALYGRLLGPLASAAYVALSHTLWAVTIAWILLACTAGQGGWVTRILSSKLLIPFSRSTYCAYLVHSAIIQWAFFNMDSPIVMSRDVVVMLMLGFMVASFLLGMVISIAFEAPMTRILNLVHPLKSRPQQVCTCDAATAQS